MQRFFHHSGARAATGGRVQRASNVVPPAARLSVSVSAEVGSVATKKTCSSSSKARVAVAVDQLAPSSSLKRSVSAGAAIVPLGLRTPAITRTPPRSSASTHGGAGAKSSGSCAPPTTSRLFRPPPALRVRVLDASSDPAAVDEQLVLIDAGRHLERARERAVGLACEGEPVAPVAHLAEELDVLGAARARGSGTKRKGTSIGTLVSYRTRRPLVTRAVDDP